jgi:hypothetical protein
MKNFIKITFILLVLFFAFKVILAANADFPERLAQGTRNFVERAIQIGIVLAFISLVFAGFSLITSAGNIQKISNAKKQILASFLGLILLFFGWFFLSQFRPEFGILSPIQPPQIPQMPGELKTAEGNYLAFAEIPIETFLKGEEKIQSHFFNVDELKKVKEVLEKILILVDEIKNKFEELKSLVESCQCSKTNPYGGSRICPPPDCEPVNEHEVCFCPLDPLGCRAESCVDDPCEGLREKMGERMKEIANYQNQIENLLLELKIKSLPIKERMAKLMFALSNLERCPFSEAQNRDVFSFSTDYLKKISPKAKWNISRIPLFEELKNPRKNSIIDFYCPKTGFYWLGTHSEEFKRNVEEFLQTIRSQAWEEIFQKTREATSVSPEFEIDISCHFSNPFGEIIEKFLAALGDLLKKIEIVDDNLPEILPGINEYYQLTFTCKPDNCRPVCGCAGGRHGCNCLCGCTGSPCDFASLDKQFEIVSEKIQKIKEAIENFDFSKIEKWLKDWEEIEAQVRRRETPLTRSQIQELYNRFPESREIVAFEILASRIHYTISHAMEVEAGWMLSTCSNYKEGSLSPDGKRVENLEDCKCEITRECQNSFPILSSYQCEYLKGDFWLANFLEMEKGECYLYNYFSCRPLERK